MRLLPGASLSAGRLLSCKPPSPNESRPALSVLDAISGLPQSADCLVHHTKHSLKPLADFRHLRGALLRPGFRDGVESEILAKHLGCKDYCTPDRYVVRQPLHHDINGRAA